MPLSYCGLVIFYNCFTISQEIHTQYIPSTTVLVMGHTWEGDGIVSRSMTHTHTNTQKERKTEETCAIPSHPKPTTNTQLPEESGQFTAAQVVSVILLSYSNSVCSPNPLQLLSEACWETCLFHQKAVDRQLLFNQKNIHRVRSSAHTQTNRSQSRCY